MASIYLFGLLIAMLLAIIALHWAAHNLVCPLPDRSADRRRADRLTARPASHHAHFDPVLQAIAAGPKELLRLGSVGDIDERTLQELERDLDLEELSPLSAKA